MVCESGGQQLYCTFACSFQFFFIILWKDVNVITERVEGRKVTNLLWLWWERERERETVFNSFDFRFRTRINCFGDFIDQFFSSILVIDSDIF
jgi:hypothetical protein